MSVPQILISIILPDPKTRAICVQVKNKKASNFLEALYFLGVWTGLEPATHSVTGKKFEFSRSSAINSEANVGIKDSES